MPPGRGVHESVGADDTLVTIGGVDAEELAAYLAGLATPPREVEPDEVREAFRRHVAGLLEALG